MPPTKRATARSTPSRSDQLEKWLSDQGFTWNLVLGVPLADFDEEKSLHNQARVGHPINTATVTRYVTAMGNGDVFPAIIAADTGRQRDLYMIVDGNHRFQAAKEAGAKTIDAYIITGADPAGITMLTFRANTKHGLPTSTEDRIHQGLYMIDSGISAADAAMQLGIKVTQLRAAAALAAVDRRAVEAGISPQSWDRLSSGARTRLGQIPMDDVFAEMAKLAVDARLKTEDVNDAVGTINRLRTTAKQKAYVQELRGVHASALQTGGRLNQPGRGRQPTSGRTMLALALGQIDGLPGAESIAERMTEADRQAYLVKVEKSLRKLESIRDELKK